MILVVVRILKKEPVQGARRLRTGERLPCRKVFEVLLMHVSSECERVRCRVAYEEWVAEVQRRRRNRREAYIYV
jgi:hypothetical protein